MNEQNLQEIWQVEVNGEIYETDVENLADWIAEGALQPQDKVRRGNLPWREAGKIGLLNNFFKAEKKDFYSSISLTPVAVTEPGISAKLSTENNTLPKNPEYDLPRPITESKNKYPRNNYKAVDKLKPGEKFEAVAEETFGFTDFAKAFVYPLKFKASLIFGAIFFTVFWLGQSAWVFGGIMLVSAIFCAMLANTLTFGILANTVENFSQDKLESNFMPRFDDFSAWDDVIHPFLLSISVYAISFGLLIALLVGATWYAVDSLKEIDKGKDKIVSSVLPVPPNDLNLVKQSEQVSKLTEQFKKQNKPNGGDMPNENSTVPSQSNTLNEAAIYENLQSQIKQAQIEPQQTAANNDLSEMPGNVMRLSLIFSIPIFLAFLWGIFYFPAACAVAAYTRSFTATLNPLIGFDTIKRLGFDYAKIIAVCLALLTFSIVLNIILSAVFAPLDLPVFGNLPVKAFGGILYFYFFIVFAVVLSIVIHKHSKSLNLFRGGKI